MDKIYRTQGENEGIRRRDCVIGIDPGVTGAVSVYDPHEKNVLTVWDMPVTRIQKGRSSSSEIDPVRLMSALGDAIAEYGVIAIIIEHVHSSPQMGVKSAFNFGDTYGVTRALAEVLHNNVQYVSPAKWKARMGLNSDKSLALDKARRLFGQSPWFLKAKDHNKAEAALLALYGATDLVEFDVDPLS